MVPVLGRMIVGGNKVYLLTPLWDTVSLLGESMPIDRGGRGAGRRPSNRQEEALHLSSSDDVTQEVPAGPAETKKDGPPDAGAMSFHAATWASVPQRLKRTHVIDILSSSS
ncbi:hypothetical protein GOODEAATRI_028799 [Goodea atripinnis]|uniref:Uncharacterized protein n=1 Tax=Goodea atripinnis TaxID=208336 RepID=A0ABV0NEI2_9TELE